MSILSILGNIVSPVAELIDSLHTSDEEKLLAKKAIQELENSISIELIQYEAKLAEMQGKAIIAEAQGQSWMQKNWRPITMLTFLALVVFDTFGWTEFRLSQEAWVLLQIGLGGYVVGRSAEKIAPQLGRVANK